MEKKIISVEILGQACKIVASTPQEEARIQKTAQLIQSEIQSTLENTGASQVTALLYTALNLGDRLFREQESAENLREKISEASEQIAKLEKEIATLHKTKEPRKTKGKKSNEETSKVELPKEEKAPETPEQVEEAHMEDETTTPEEIPYDHLPEEVSEDATEAQTKLY